MPKNKTDQNLTCRDGKWYLDFTVDGKRIRRLAGFSKEQARNAAAKLRVERLNERLGLSKPEAREAVPFETFADEFLKVYSKQNKRSWVRDEIMLKNLKRFFPGMALHEIGPEDVERFKANRKAEKAEHFKATKTTPISPATINRELTCLKTLFNKAEEWGRIEKNPIRNVRKLKEPNFRERILTAEEVERLIENASASFRPILIVALNTGMRRSEILSLKWANVDLIRCYIFIEDSKSGRSRKIPINGSVMEALAPLPQAGEFVFFNPETGTHIQDVKTAFHAACKKSKKDPDKKDDPGITGVRFHDLRHTAASKMIEAGVDLVTVSKILGHASIQMTMRYAHPTPENMRRAVELLSKALHPAGQKVDTAQAAKSASNSYANN